MLKVSLESIRTRAVKTLKDEGVVEIPREDRDQG
jgi:hypothetical protein